MYIYNYICNTYPMVLELQDKNYCFNIAKEIHDKHPNTNFELGKYDFYINECIRSKLKESETFKKYSDIKNHVYMAIIYYKTVNNVEINDAEILLNEIVKRISSAYSYEDIISNKCDEAIEKLIENRNIILSVLNSSVKYSFIEKSFTDEDYAKECILDYLIKYKDAFTCNVGFEKLTEKIYLSMIELGIKLEDIILNKHNDYIMSCIMNKKYGIIWTNKFNDMLSCVYKYVEAHTRKLSNKSFIIYEVYKTAMFLTREGYTSNDVTYGIVDDLIDESIMYGMIKVNSAISDEYGDMTLTVKKHTIMPNAAKTRLLMETITLMYKAYSTKTSDDVFSEPISIDFIDNYRYKNISYELSDDFSCTADNIIKVYENYTKYGSEYGQLCLLKVYESFASEKYHGMDMFITFLKEKTDTSNKTTLRNELSTSTCYFRYVYNKLIEAGISNIYGASYLKTVKSYEELYEQNKNKHIYDLLSIDDRKNLRKMMKNYERYCEKLFNKMIKTINDNLL